jgi:hypothetical protein
MQQPLDCGVMLGLVVTGLSGPLESGANLPSPLDMSLWGGFCSFLCGKEESGEKGQQEMNLTHTLQERLRQQNFMLVLVWAQGAGGRQPLGTFISRSRTLSAALPELRRH